MIGTPTVAVVTDPGTVIAVVTAAFETVILEVAPVDALYPFVPVTAATDAVITAVPAAVGVQLHVAVSTVGDVTVAVTAAQTVTGLPAPL